MTAPPLVTFTVKAYRQEHLVRHAVESAFAQTWPNLEILLSDDNSPDGTFRVMEEMAAAYRGPHRVRLNRNPVNLGIMAHSNRIWELASGDLIASCAGDDIAEPDKVARLAEAWMARRGRVMLVHSWARTIDAEGRVIGEMRPDPRIVEDSSPVEIARLLTNAIGATCLYDRRLHDHFGPIPAVAQIEDAPQFFRAALLGEIAYVDAPLVRYRVGGVSDRSAPETGRDYLRGRRMTFLSWGLTNAQAFLEDMEKVGDFPGREECRSLCRRHILRRELEVAMWRAGPLGRLRLLPRAVWRSLRMRDPAYARQALKHLLGPLYIRWHDWRMRRARRPAG